MKRIMISFLALGTVLSASAQDMNNLVENPSFEQTEGRIKRGGAIAIAIGWMSPTTAAADLFSSSNKEGYGTPNNNLGMEEAQDGENYAGFRAFSYNDKEARNYVSSKLKMTMVKDQKYCVTFYVNLAEASKYASNNIGINFSKKQYNITEPKSIMTTTSVRDKDNLVYSGQFGWDQICGVYKAEGGEKFLTIGNFSANGETQNTRLKKGSFTGTEVVSAYYFLDNISVVPIDDESQCECQADAGKPQTNFIYEVAPLNIEGMEPAQVANGTTIYFGYGDETFTENTKAHLKNMLDMLLANPRSKIMISTNSDLSEAKDPTLVGIGEKRSEAIKLYFMTNGISYTRILTEDLKDSRPADPAETDLAKAKNRRVTFTYIP
jgi:outer membrane protein OmpA-like peptidoglycan-associated protein